jgi:hypothetical protein
MRSRPRRSERAERVDPARLGHETADDSGWRLDVRRLLWKIALVGAVAGGGAAAQAASTSWTAVASQSSGFGKFVSVEFGGRVSGGKLKLVVASTPSGRPVQVMIRITNAGGFDKHFQFRGKTTRTIVVDLPTYPLSYATVGARLRGNTAATISAIMYDGP